MKEPAAQADNNKGLGKPVPDESTKKISSSALLWAAGAFAAAAVMIFWHLGLMPLLNPDEGRNASVGWETQQAGTWLVPTYNGLAYLDKPAFFFKAVAFSLSLFGHSEFAARLPSAVFAAGTLLMVFGFCRKEYDLRTAALAVAVVSTTPLFFAFARYVIFDMTLAFFVCGAIFAGYFAESAEDETQRRRWRTLSAAAMGFAMLVKGPVGVILPLLVLGLFNRADGRRGAMKKLLCGRNILLFLVIFLPWFVGVSLQRHDFPYYGIMFESVKRFTTASAHRTQPFYFYLWLIPAVMLFWSLVLPQTLWISWKRRTALSRADKLLLVWALAVTVFFSISQSKLPGYVLTGVIALGILIARQFAKAFENRNEVSVRSGAWLLGLTASGAAAASAWYGAHLKTADLRIYQQLSDSRAVVFQLHQIVAPAAIAFIAITVIAIYGAVRRDAGAVFIAFAACPLVVVMLGLPALVAGEQHRADAQLAQDIAKAAPHIDVACYLCFPPGIPFYLGRDIIVITGKNGNEIQSNYIPFTLDKTSLWPDRIQRVGNFRAWVAQLQAPVFLLANKDNLSVLETLAKARHSQVQALAGGRYGGLLITPGGH
jgi:4-amino-4-deoxy-L-arabinose transferase-like glycosyltransferase